MSDADFEVEVPEADRLEQLQDVSGSTADDYDADEPPTIDTSEANPADVLEQQVAVPEDDEDDR